MALSESEKAILKTLAYSDIFNFPLTKDEIWKFLISDKKVSRTSFEKALNLLSRSNNSARRVTGICLVDNYFCLDGQEATVVERVANAEYVEKKLKIAAKAAGYLSCIPSILFIGISGGLAMGDANKGDDIDFFVITKKNTIFKTRLFILCMLQLLGFRRKRLEKNPTNKICVNFLIDEKKLYFPPDKHDVYIAHEIVQIKPLFERDNTFSKFLKVNEWIRNFLPNSIGIKSEINQRVKINKILQFICSMIDFLSVEGVWRYIQIAYMKNHMREEVVTKHTMAFNPNDYRVYTLRKLRLKLRELGLLTKH